MISFYDLRNTQQNIPTSRIEGLVGIPLCLEYYRWPANNNDSNLETLLVGDDLGICHMYTITDKDWHICTFKIEEQNKEKKNKTGQESIIAGNDPMVKRSVVPMMCHRESIIQDYERETEEIFQQNQEKKK